MKSEKIMRAIGGIDDDIIEAADSEKTTNPVSKVWIRRGAFAAVFVLVLTGAIALHGALKKSVPTDGNTSVAQSKKQDDQDINVIWADDASAGSESEMLTKWGRFGKVSNRLYNALETAETDDVLAVLARPVIDYDFEYNGKTMERYYSDMCDEKNLPDKLHQLLKEGDSLKYGTALYETGTPDGEKWYKSLYEERINYYGDAILAKYIVNGRFLKEQLEQDIKTAENASQASDAYLKAIKAYLGGIADAVHGTLPTETFPKENCIVMYLTKDQFSSLEFENATESVFGLALKNGDGAVADTGVAE